MCLRNAIVRLFAYNYASLLYKRKRDEYSAADDLERITYRYLAVMPGLILMLLLLAPYAVFIREYPAPVILTVLDIIALVISTIIMLRIYKNESVAIKRAGKKILNASKGVPYPSLVIILSPAALLFAITLVLWIETSSPT